MAVASRRHQFQAPVVDSQRLLVAGVVAHGDALYDADGHFFSVVAPVVTRRRLVISGPAPCYFNWRSRLTGENWYQVGWYRYSFFSYFFY